MLRLVLPKGSLERATFELFEQADLAVSRASGIDYRGSIDDERIDEVRILRPQEIPRYVAEGLFDIGVTGRDCIEETGAEVVSLGELHFAKVTNRPVRVVLAVAEDSPVQSVGDLAKLAGPIRISTEYPEITKKYMEKAGVNAEVRFSYGATEAKVPDIADAVVDMTETGGALRAARLRIIETILVSSTELIANPSSYEDPAKRHAMHQIHTLLQGTLDARGRVLVKLNVSGANLDTVIGVLPAMRSPTVSQLFNEEAYAVETVVPKSRINVLIPALKDAGATDIIELPLSKIVP
jgi:ATP phosphoribosyltransferase